MKVLLDYDPTSMALYEPGGARVLIANWGGLDRFQHIESATTGPDVERLAKLKAAGFTAAEIVEMSKAGLL